MQLSDKTPTRLVQVSLFFSAAHFLFGGVTWSNILLFLVFTGTVYISTKLFIILQQLQMATVTDLSELKLYLLGAAVLFVGIATFAYSYMFGVFYLFITGVYFISPYDRAWLAGKSRMVVYDNKVEYREV
ncbi:hypothetical protein EUZ85_04370 [Hahella sp. KA22]|uniref:hypothetical protein n=1 Tax=Hahella sp. KA22 TaxID=1628392 RepID=UPI000FDE3C38|nr:hypothetical protein [Hahella sp. KA22]AZZ89983.1 hypothetical protein ENC22_01825 [Hahella sp. KA22]QAY53351.1 hypothetical protein EUZ85_04370 [Hahella sp. KA22]